MNARAGFLFGVLAALIAAAPAALRAGSSLSESRFLVWVALTGAAASVLGPLLAARGHARAAQNGLLAVALGLGLAAWPVALLLSVLKSSTHHRPLGAVTFAFAAAVVVAVACIAALRVLSWFQAGGTAKAVRTALVVLAALGPLVLLVRLSASAPARASLFDAGLALGVAALALLVPWPPRLLALAGRLGPAVWGLVVGIGFLSAHACREAALEASPALLSPFHWLLR